MREHDARCVVPAAAELGEGPLWSSDDAALYWVDILGRRMHRYRPDDARAERCALPFALTALAPAASGALLCSGEQQLHRLDLDSGRLHALIDPRIDDAGVRINDAACSSDGAFWFGTLDCAERAPLGDFFRLDADGTLERIGAGFAITNGPAFAPDGTAGYFVDTLARRILRAPLKKGRLAGAFAPFAEIGDGEGYPDGLALDADGGVWCAHFGGGCVTRFDADGRATDRVRLPVANATKCAFGGAGFERLFITTARKGLDAAALAAQPLAGGLFEAAVGRVGLAAARYRGRPALAQTFVTCNFEEA